MTDLADQERRFEEHLRGVWAGDPAHDLEHVHRVVRTAKALAASEGARLDVVVPAAWLHDVVAVAKDSADRSRASSLAAAEATSLLLRWRYPGALVAEIAHAIEAHSFSAGIEPRAPEARVVQDADRLDALGSIGIARCFAVGGALGRPLYDPADPFCERRPPDDARFTVDHFFAKLLDLPATMRTAAGRTEGERRAERVRAFLGGLREELR